MTSLIDSVNEYIDDMALSEFNASVSVCKSLMDVYNKSLTLMEYADNEDLKSLQVFGEAFITEGDESIWRKTNSKGNKENIIISILLLPVRLIQALIKRIKRSRVKQESKDLDKKLTELSELVNNYTPQTVAKPTSQANVQYKPSTQSTQKTAEVKMSVDDSKDNSSGVEMNIDLEKVSDSLEKVEETVKNRWSGLNAKISFYDLNPDYVEAVIAQNLASGNLNPKTAEEFRKMTQWTATKPKKSDFLEVRDQKNSLVERLDSIEKACDNYKKAIERMIDAIYKSASYSDSEVDKQKKEEAIRKLRELASETEAIVGVTADGLLVIESYTRALNKAADEILSSVKNENT